jgi:hypothetical protein
MCWTPFWAIFSQTNLVTLRSAKMKKLHKEHWRCRCCFVLLSLSLLLLLLCCPVVVVLLVLLFCGLWCLAVFDVTHKH